jgi:hypothetical protein
VIVVRNTYPYWPKCAHAEAGDVCHWDKGRGCMSLVRDSDGKTVFSRDLLSPGQHDKDRPVVGVVAQVKSKGWFLEVADEARKEKV